MNPAPPALALALFALAPAARCKESAAPPDDTLCRLRFAPLGNDTLSGNFASLENGVVFWKSPLLEKPAPFYIGKLLEMTLPGSFHQPEGDHEATLTVVPWPETIVPSQIKGRLVRVTPENIELDTWYAGRLTIRRPFIRAIEIEDSSNVIFAGPAGVEGWAMEGRPSPAWTYSGGELSGNPGASIGREIDLPDSVALSFNVRPPADKEFSVFVFANSVDSPTRGYKLSVLRGSVSVGRTTGDDNPVTVNLPDLLSRPVLHIEFRVSRSTGAVCFYLDGTQYAQYTDSEVAKRHFGKWIGFSDERGSSVTDGTPLRISRIKVARWDGQAEMLPPDMARGFGGIGRRGGFNANSRVAKPPAPGTVASGPGRVQLRNGDSVEGQVTSIDNGKLHLKTPFAEVDLPISRVRNIGITATAEPEQPIRRNGDIRAWFADGSSMVFALDNISGDTLTGSSQLFGRADFKLSAFNRIEFNVQDDRIRRVPEKQEGSRDPSAP